jgi:hypothetical protein
MVHHDGDLNDKIQHAFLFASKGVDHSLLGVTIVCGMACNHSLLGVTMVCGMACRREVEEYAVYLGMDMADDGLLWIADMALAAPLPKGWSRAHVSRPGRHALCPRSGVLTVPCIFTYTHTYIQMHKLLRYDACVYVCTCVCIILVICM